MPSREEAPAPIRSQARPGRRAFVSAVRSTPFRRRRCRPANRGGRPTGLALRAGQRQLYAQISDQMLVCRGFAGRSRGGSPGSGREPGRGDRPGEMRRDREHRRARPGPAAGGRGATRAARAGAPTKDHQAPRRPSPGGPSGPSPILRSKRGRRRTPRGQALKRPPFSSARMKPRERSQHCEGHQRASGLDDGVMPGKDRRPRRSPGGAAQGQAPRLVPAMEWRPAAAA